MEGRFLTATIFSTSPDCKRRARLSCTALSDNLAVYVSATIPILLSGLGMMRTSLVSLACRGGLASTRYLFTSTTHTCSWLNSFINLLATAWSLLETLPPLDRSSRVVRLERQRSKLRLFFANMTFLTTMSRTQFVSRSPIGAAFGGLGLARS